MGLAKSGLVAVAALIMALTTVRGEDSPMPDEIAWKLLELGRVIDPPKTAAIYAPLQQKETYRGIKVERDIKYGPAERNLRAVVGSRDAEAAELASVVELEALAGGHGARCRAAQRVVASGAQARRDAS